MKNIDISTIQRFHSIDVLRGFAALTVVFTHWRHFFYNGTVFGNYNIDSLPLYSILFPLYDGGLHAVALFFSLSGFVFFWLYSGRINNKSISVWNFSVLRFSRLYPLHFITLLVVLLLQLFMYYRIGDFFIYKENDLYHFILNIFFISEWGLQRGQSFNGPIWSVSIEILLYSIFFIICRIISARISVLFLFTIFGLISVAIFGSSIGTGIFFFFLGGIIYLVYLEVIKRKLTEKLEKPLMFVTLSGWGMAVLDIKYNLIESVILKLLPFQLIYNGHDYTQKFAHYSDNLFFYGWLFSITILTLVLIETGRGHLGQRLSFIGNISYSSYLIHFPLQLIFIILIGFLGMDASFFDTVYSLLVFFLVLIVLSMMSFRFFEIPAQKVLREKLLYKKI